MTEKSLFYIMDQSSLDCEGEIIFLYHGSEQTRAAAVVVVVVVVVYR